MKLGDRSPKKEDGSFVSHFTVFSLSANLKQTHAYRKFGRNRSGKKGRT